jgi:hypothetical protein
MNPPRRWLGELAGALYLDAGYILDSIWRRAEFNAHRYFRYDVSRVSAEANATEPVAVRLTPRPEISLPRFWFFAAVVVFVAYGPTLDSLCSVFTQRGMTIARFLIGAMLVFTALYLLVRLTLYGAQRANRRFFKAKIAPQDRLRRGTVHLIVELGVITLVVPLALLGVCLWTQATAPICHRVTSPLPAIGQLILTMMALALATLAARGPAAPADSRRAVLSFLLLGVLTGFLWMWIAAPSPSEATQTPYPHVYAVFALGVAAVAAISPFWARFMFAATIATQRDLFRSALGQREIFPGPRVDPELSATRVVAATVTGIVYNLLELLLLPAFFLLIVPSEWIPVTVVLGLMAATVLVTLGSLTARWQQMLMYVKRSFFVGTPLIISVVVIGLAGLRLAKFQYVTTVLDAAPFGVIFVWIVMNYVLFWWFEYVINDAAARELLRLLGTDSEAASGRVPYRPEPSTPVTMPTDHRWITPHGMGRLAALGWVADKDSKEPHAVFQAFDFVDLFTRITPAGHEEIGNDLRRQLRLYFFALNAALLLGLAAFLAYYGHDDRTNTVAPLVHASRPAPESVPADLKTLLAARAARHRPAIIVATSGGGTRAALFTASALQGLAKLGLSQDIVLLSGVSGGGVAAAYFYAHQQALQRPYPASQQAWRDFEYHMTDPFIADVLEGAGEWRVVSRMALGVLLKESFERQLFASPALQHVGAAAGPGLILNTTITGSPQEDSDLLRGRFLPAKKAETCDQRHLPYANVSGGRLIFTNLRDRSAFPDSGAEPRTAGAQGIADVRLPYVVVQDPQVSLAAAAALNANFPPVFTNARVDVPAEVQDDECPDRPYYVTDGGATENLGFVSALYALRKALRDLAATAGSNIPELHLVLIEASATTYDYTPDRGINAATGGSKERLTGGLTVELVNQINTEFQQAHPGLPTIQTHYLVMPLAFRSRGGFGTHWMFPQSIPIVNPRKARPAAGFGADKGKVLLHRCELLTLWERLHAPRGDFCTPAAFAGRHEQSMRTVAGWVCGQTSSPPLPPDLHIEQWNQLVGQLGGDWRAPSASSAATAKRLPDCKD